MILYSFTYTHRNAGGSRTSWFSTEKEARTAMRVFQQSQCGDAGPFVCRQQTVDRHVVRHKGELLGMLNSITNGYEVDKYV